MDFRQPAFFSLKAVLVFSGRCGRRPSCNSFLSFQSLIRMRKGVAKSSFAPGSCPIRCKRLNPPVDLRFAIADLRFEKVELTYP